MRFRELAGNLLQFLTAKCQILQLQICAERVRLSHWLLHILWENTEVNDMDALM
jgi:hypothetical protein